MPPRDWPQRIQDVLDAIAKIQRYAASLSYKEFAACPMAVDAVLYSFGIIGEAITEIPEALRDQHPQIPWRDIRRTRNVVIHVCFGVNIATIWRTIQEDLAPFAQQLEALLAEATKDATEPPRDHL